MCTLLVDKTDCCGKHSDWEGLRIGAPKLFRQGDITEQITQNLKNT